MPKRLSPGRFLVAYPDLLWQNHAGRVRTAAQTREVLIEYRDPESLRRAFDGPTAREWLLKRLPCRAYENGVFAVFTNPVGVDDDQIRNGNAMIIDPHGNIVAECRTLGDDVVVATYVPALIGKPLRKKFIKARRSDLYGGLLSPSEDAPETTVDWM